MKFIKKIITASFSIVLLLLTSQAHAALITETFEVDVVTGPGTGVLGSIVVEYDDALILGIGDESLDNPDFALTLDLFGQIFTNADDIDFPALPSLDFFDGEITFIDYVISEVVGDNRVLIDDPAIGTISGGLVEPGLDQFPGVWMVDTEGPAGIPEPSVVLLFLLSLSLISFSRAKKIKK